jgi:hypothetical protein
MFRLLFPIVALVILFQFNKDKWLTLKKDGQGWFELYPHSSIIYEESFEDSTVFLGAHLQFGTDHAFKVVNDPVFDGNKAGRFELRTDDPMVSNGTRSEVLFNTPDHYERWYSFAAYFPSENYLEDSDNDIINQWHQKGSPATSLRIRKDRFILRVGNTPENRKDIDIGMVSKDKWHKFIFHIIHANDQQGLIEIWHNDTQILSYRGGNMYAGRLPRWKVGIYKDDWNGDEKTETSKRVYYIDNIKIGSEEASIEDM